MYGGANDIDPTNTDLPLSSGSENRVVEATDPEFAADNTVSIQRSTTAGQIGIEIEEPLAADNVFSGWS